MDVISAGGNGAARREGETGRRKAVESARPFGFSDHQFDGRYLARRPA